MQEKSRKVILPPNPCAAGWVPRDLKMSQAGCQPQPLASKDQLLLGSCCVRTPPQPFKLQVVN